MSIKTGISLAVALALTSAAVAAEEIHKKTVLALVGAGDDGGTSLAFDSETAGFDLHELQLGENRSFVDDQGRNVLVTRAEDGFVFTVDGEIIHVPALDGDDATLDWVEARDGEEVEVHIVHAGDGETRDVRREVRVIRKAGEEDAP
ncbi:MAG: hypothetical protein R3176_00985 [Woeseiaceae bacterium]|nr:hypothetical protein [Woeseiaceae bacterium]